MKETGLTGKGRSTTIAATPDDGKSQRKKEEELCGVDIIYCVAWSMYFKLISPPSQLIFYFSPDVSQSTRSSAIHSIHFQVHLPKHP